MLMAQTAVRTLQESRETDPVIFLDTLNRTIYKNVQRMNSEKSLTLVIANYAVAHLNCILEAGGTPTPQEFYCFLRYNLNAATAYADRNISISRQQEETLVVRNGGQVERIDTSDFVDRQFQEYSS